MKMEKYVSPKPLYLPTSPHGVTAQKNAIDMNENFERVQHTAIKVQSITVAKP
jgi:hypothetical protein